jgi:NRAMP (natural resistance-associated macrophage protein)-like metal ion transporter
MVCLMGDILKLVCSARAFSKRRSCKEKRQSGLFSPGGLAQWRFAIGQLRLAHLGLGPGLITGASDDDPSGIATYAQVGAQFRFCISWTMLFSFPLMAAIQEISGRMGRTTGQGLASNIRRHYPAWLLNVIVGLLFIANTINIGADLGAIGDALALLIGGPDLIYVFLAGVLCTAAQVIADYSRIASMLKWLTLSLFAYFGTVMAARVPWGEMFRGLFIPSLSASTAFWTAIVAILGTTISPYLFFWQASQEAEDIEATPVREPLNHAPHQAGSAFERIRFDTYAGMAFSNLVALAIIVTTAATLHAQGITNVETSSQAAEALRPIAGRFAFAVFALGIIGTGLLAVPVLAGSAAYAIGEARKWPTGLARQPMQAKAFYTTLAIATLAGAGLNFTSINPIQALYLSAVINGLVATPVMVLMMLLSANAKVMGQFKPLRFVGWLAAAVMAAAVAGMLIAASL